MGTRSLTAIKRGDKDSEEICVVYAQYDGYPDGHGVKLKRLLKKYAVVNGLSGISPNVANGMSCLAAQLITLLKRDHLRSSRRTMKIVNRGRDLPPVRGDGMAGTYYLEPAGTRGAWEDYLYTLYLVEHPEGEQDAKRQALWDKCKEKGDYTEIHNMIFPVGELHLMVQAKKGEEYITLYDGPLKSFKPKACKVAETDDG